MGQRLNFKNFTAKINLKEKKKDNSIFKKN